MQTNGSRTVGKSSKIYGRSNENGQRPRKCLREEFSRIINEDTTVGKELKGDMEGVGKGAIWNIIRNGDQGELK